MRAKPYVFILIVKTSLNPVFPLFFLDRLSLQHQPRGGVVSIIPSFSADSGWRLPASHQVCPVKGSGPR